MGQNMLTFSPLETLLCSLFFAIISAIAVRLFLGKKYMTREECAAYHGNDAKIRESVGHKIDNLAQQNQVIFRMIRGLVIYSEMDAGNKERILNERGPDNG